MQIRLIHNNKILSAEEKRNKIDKILIKRNKIFRTAVGLTEKIK